MIKFVSSAVFALAMLTVPTAAQDGPLGLAWVQAPEMGGGLCFGTDARKTIDCAVDNCIADTGLEAADCTVEGWCSPARWTADIFIQHAEGPHWHSVLCGWSSREKLEQAVELYCAEDYFIECSIVRVWDPEGNEQTDAKV